MAANPDIVLGFDYGQRRIGVAVGNRLLGQARPLGMLSAGTARQWPQLDAWLAEWTPAALIVGRPVDKDGSRQPILAAAERFMRQLEQNYQLPVHSVDERYTSVAAQSELKARRRAGLHGRARTGEEDAEAARLITEDWLRTHA